MSFNHVFKVSVRKKKTKDKGSTQYFRPILWSINRIWEPWGHFILHSLGEFPVATAQKETRKHQCLFCLSCVLLKGIWSHCALSPLSWNSSPKPQWDPPLTFKSMYGKRSDVKLALSWYMTYSSLLATDIVSFPCSILQDCLSAAHLTTVTFFNTVSVRSKRISKEVLKGVRNPKVTLWNLRVCSTSKEHSKIEAI